jgi:hypothetical protein
MWRVSIISNHISEFELYFFLRKSGFQNRTCKRLHKTHKYDLQTLNNWGYVSYLIHFNFYFISVGPLLKTIRKCENPQGGIAEEAIVSYWSPYNVAPEMEKHKREMQK